MVSATPPGNACVEHSRTPGCTSLGSSSPARALPALNTFRQSNFYPVQLQLSCQCVFCSESSVAIPAHAHFSFDCLASSPASAWSMPGPPRLFPSSVPVASLGHLCGEFQNTPVYIYFSFSCPAKMNLMYSPRCLWLAPLVVA